LTGKLNAKYSEEEIAADIKEAREEQRMRIFIVTSISVSGMIRPQ
jgi:hypothetical protein